MRDSSVLSRQTLPLVCMGMLASFLFEATAQAADATAFPSTYVASHSGSTLIRSATVLTGTGARLDEADVLLVDGLVSAVGRELTAPAGAHVIDARGKWVTPGLIDVHSHLGNMSQPRFAATLDANEETSPVTPEVWAEHGIWPQDPGFETALQGGVTTLQILPGSANLIGGRGVTVKNVAAATYQAMKFPGAPHGVKLACGENPKQVYGSRQLAPMTRMGNMAGYRQAFADAQDYQRQRLKYEAELAAHGRKKGKDAAESRPIEPKRDLRLETLAAVMSGEIQVHIHCYRADEMAAMLDLAREFDFKVAAFHHAVESYKIANLLADAGVCAAIWADWWGFKLEAYDSIQENIAFVDRAKDGCAIVHSDSAEAIQRLNQEAAKGMMRGARMGWPIAPERAIRWITANPARVLGIDGRTGTLEHGKMADVVVWNRNPFSVYALTEQVFIDGALVYERDRPRATPQSDFLLGTPRYEPAS